MPLHIDDSEWPIVVVTWRGTPADDEIRDVLRGVDSLLSRGERVGLLIDARKLEGLSSDQRRGLVMHMKANAELTSKLLVQAVVHDNVVLRALDLAIQCIIKPLYERKTLGSIEEARAWLRERLQAGAPD